MAVSKLKLFIAIFSLVAVVLYACNMCSMDKVPVEQYVVTTKPFDRNKAEKLLLNTHRFAMKFIYDDSLHEFEI